VNDVHHSAPLWRFCVMAPSTNVMTYSHLNVVVKTFVLPVTGHASYHAPTTLSGTGVLLWLDPVCETVCPQTYDLRCNSGHSSDNSKQYCLVDREHGA